MPTCLASASLSLLHTSHVAGSTESRRQPYRWNRLRPSKTGSGVGPQGLGMLRPEDRCIRDTGKPKAKLHSSYPYTLKPLNPERPKPPNPLLKKRGLGIPGS